MKTEPNMLAGFSGTPQRECEVYRPERMNELLQIEMSEGEKISSGSELSYGDQFVTEGNVVSFKRLNRFIDYDPENGRIEVESGVTIREVLEVISRDGLFLEVTPGCSDITVGGAVAFDIHGKNHYQKNSFGSLVESLRIIQNGKLVVCDRQKNATLFANTLAGAGLTGFIISVSLRLSNLPEKGVVQTTSTCCSSVSELLKAAENGKHSSDYWVTWIDAFTIRKEHFNGIVFGSQWTETGQRYYRPEVLSHSFSSTTQQNKMFPLLKWFWSSFSVSLYNRLFYYKNRNSVRAESDLRKFLFPWDAMINWNSLYGKNGFIEYQAIFPIEVQEEALKALFRLIEARPGRSQKPYLMAIKLFSGSGEGCLSYACEGISVLMDFVDNAANRKFMDELDELFIRFNGRVYLAKDKRLPKNAFNAMYKNADAFRQFRAENQLATRYGSLFSKRLDI